MSSPETVISTDSLGLVRADWKLLRQMWGSLTDKAEVIGFRSMLERLYDQAADCGFHIQEIHGRVGWNRDMFGSIMTDVADTLIVSTAELIDQYAANCPVLLHTTEALANEKLIISKKESIKLLWVENQPHSGAVNDTEKTIKTFNDQGVSVGFMFDLAHYLYGENDNDQKFSQRWEKTLNVLNDIIKTNAHVGIHFPIGTRKNDSLPVLDGKISPDMFRDVAVVLHGENEPHQAVEQIVLESQHGLRLAAWQSKRDIGKIRRHHEAIVDKLVSTGIIRL